MKKKTILKRIAFGALCVMLCYSAIGCGSKDDANNKTEVKTESTENVNGSEDTAKENEVADNKNSVKSETSDENKTTKNAENNSASDAPVVESGEELTNMIDEFNSTENPQRKEELRQQLEKILEQAEQQSAAE